MEPDFICLMGIDGSGKTTQARRLVARLNQAGIPARYVWCRWQPLLMKPVQLAGRALLKRRAVGPTDYRAFTSSKQRFLGRGPLGRLWLAASLLDYLLVQVFPRIVLGRLRGKCMVCDRYLYDTLIDQGINLGLSADEGPQLADRALVRLFPRPARVILIDLDPKLAFERKTDVADPEYLRDRRARYLRFAESLGAATVDGSGPPETVADRIAAALGLPAQPGSPPTG